MNGIVIFFDNFVRGVVYFICYFVILLFYEMFDGRDGMLWVGNCLMFSWVINFMFIIIYKCDY